MNRGAMIAEQPSTQRPKSTPLQNREATSKASSKHGHLDT